MHVVVTGAAGFIGHHVVDYLLNALTDDIQLTLVDSFTYASCGTSRLDAIGATRDNKSIRNILTIDLASAPLSPSMITTFFNDVDIVLHLAAETHVDKSIVDPVKTVCNNVLSTLHVLELVRVTHSKLVYMSTDEVYGDTSEYKQESERHNPHNPYSASKAAGEMLVNSYINTYGVDAVIVNCMNVYGPRQHMEKFIPKLIYHMLRGGDTPFKIHCADDGVTPGKRTYIHASLVARAIWTIAIKHEYDDKQKTFNIVGECEVDNLTMANKVADVVLEMHPECKRPEFVNVIFDEERAGHDVCYRLDGTLTRDTFGIDYYNRDNEGFTKRLDATVRSYVDGVFSV